MLRILPLIAAIAISLPVSAEVYTWKDENGVTHFGQQPPAGQRETVDIRDNRISPDSSPRAESDVVRQAREMERQRKLQELEARRDSRLREARQSSDSPDYICQGAKNRVKNLKDRWDDIKRQGYTQSQRSRYERLITQAERSRDNVCR